MSKNINFAFFGGEPLAVPTLQKLYGKGFVPSLVVCNPDKPQGRNMKVSPPPTAVWAKEHNIEIFQPKSLKDRAIIEHLKKEKWDFFVVVAYGKIIPSEVIEMPKYGTINIHPSLLPSYRGPSPIVAPILNGDMETGVTIIKIDEEMDHGPIIAQKKIELSGTELIQDLEASLADLGGELLANIIPELLAGNITYAEQDHSKATYVKKITKTDGEIELEDDGIKNWRKFRAYAHWPRTFFFKDGKRIIITKARLENGKFIVEKIIPEGGKEIEYKD